MVAAFAFILVLVVLIPVLAIVIDSPVGQALARRISSGEDAKGAGPRLDALEAEVRYLTETVESLSEESEFLRSLVEGPAEDTPRLTRGPDEDASSDSSDG
jgi:hypothetical protein